MPLSIPGILLEEDVLVPLKIDITHSGARLVDTFCWSLYNARCSPQEFSDRLSVDLNLPYPFRQKIALQIEEQVKAYGEIVKTIFSCADKIPNWANKMQEIQNISIGIRHNTLDYSDKIQWSPLSVALTPEEFAITTCQDLGLPFEMEPAIAHKIREHMFRWLINLIDNPQLCETVVIGEEKTSETKVSLVQPNQAVDMAINLWKRAKPNTLEECAVIPQPLLPVNKDSNATVWIK